MTFEAFIFYFFAAILLYRILAFWAPIPPGIVAFIHLRKTVQRWEETRRARSGEGANMAGALPGSPIIGSPSFMSGWEKKRRRRAAGER